ncbi:MAG: hypothetical protein SCK28_15775, partial [Bacillota bacterium]|nr:hypothetical protein [Bacillota bacterium]
MSYHYCWKGYVYIAWNKEQVTMGLTPWPLLDLAYLKEAYGYQELLCLTPELPIGQAYYFGHKLAGQELLNPVHLRFSDG